MTSDLDPCPHCGKPEGALKDTGRGKFRHYVVCGACQWMTAISRTEGIAAKLWNEAKPLMGPATPKDRGSANRRHSEKGGKHRQRPEIGVDGMPPSWRVA